MDKFETIKDPHPGMIGWVRTYYSDQKYESQEIVIVVRVLSIKRKTVAMIEKEAWRGVEESYSLEVAPLASDTTFLIDPGALMARRTVDTRRQKETVHCPG